MRPFFKTTVFLAALGITVLVTAHAAPAFSQSTAAENAEKTERLNAELEEKRARAAKNREAMQEKVKDGNKKYNKLSGMDEDDQKEVDARVKNMLAEHPDAAPGKTTDAVEDRIPDKKKTAQAKKPRHVTGYNPQRTSLYEEANPRAAPRYIQEYLDAIKALKKEHEPYTLPPPRK